MSRSFSPKTDGKAVRIILLSIMASMVALLFALAPNGSPICKLKKKNVAHGKTEENRKYIAGISDTKDPFQDEAVDNSFDQDFEVKSWHELKKIFIQSGFHLPESHQKGTEISVPRLYLVSLPGDFRGASINSKKKLFIKSLLPLILRANENILEERRKLLALKSHHLAGIRLNTQQKAWLKETARKYRVKSVCFRELEKRIDVIPPSLALGQAIVETGWGSSNLALRKNSTFGMRTASRVLVYDSLMESVENYMKNINAHPAYKSMREIRHNLRKENQKICSIKLTKGLLNYSTRGESYVREVANLISRHNLQKYDIAQLNGPQDL